MNFKAISIKPGDLLVHLRFKDKDSLLILILTCDELTEKRTYTSTFIKFRKNVGTIRHDKWIEFDDRDWKLISLTGL